MKRITTNYFGKLIILSSDYHTNTTKYAGNPFPIFHKNRNRTDKKFEQKEKTQQKSDFCGWFFNKTKKKESRTNHLRSMKNRFQWRISILFSFLCAERFNPNRLTVFIPEVFDFFLLIFHTPNEIEEIDEEVRVEWRGNSTNDRARKTEKAMKCAGKSCRKFWVLTEIAFISKPTKCKRRDNRNESRFEWTNHFVFKWKKIS